MYTIAECRNLLATDREENLLVEKSHLLCNLKGAQTADVLLAGALDGGEELLQIDGKV